MLMPFAYEYDFWFIYEPYAAEDDDNLFVLQSFSGFGKEWCLWHFSTITYFIFCHKMSVKGPKETLFFST